MFTFTLETGRPICRRSVSGSGIPGVGVAPGFIGFPSVFGSGMPGVGVPPFGAIATWFAAGIPGVELAEGGSGLVESPGGMLAAFTVTLTFVFAAVFEFGAVVLQADAATEAQIKASINLEDIVMIPFVLK